MRGKSAEEWKKGEDKGFFFEGGAKLVLVLFFKRRHLEEGLAH